VILSLRFELHRGRFRDSGQVECFLDREPAADLGGSGDIVGRERCSCLIDELAPRRLVGVDVDDALLVGVDPDRLPVGVEAFPGMEPNDLALRIESRRALVAGATLIDRGNSLEFPTDWANKGIPSEQILEGLRPVLELAVELVLPTHGAPTDRAALERALS